jgi:hypothetical protein
MRKNLISVLDYFAHFSYAPSLREIHTFYPERISIKNLSELLNVACESGRLVRLSNISDVSLSQSLYSHSSLTTSHSRYTLPQYSIKVHKKSNNKNQNRNNWPNSTIQIYLFLLKYLPFVRFVGITGATAMSGFTPHDDVDLFIITKGGMIWSSRLCTVILAKILRIHGGTGVCLNMFFDEDGLSIPKIKQNKYIAHELLQMKPRVDKTSTYSLLIQANLWVFDFFPNARHLFLHSPRDSRINNDSLSYLIEQFLKSIQIPLIKRNRTDFLIGEHQLWLFKKDFERSLRKKYRL